MASAASRADPDESPIAASARARDRPGMTRRLPALLLALWLLATAAPAIAKDGDSSEVRLSGTCGRGASSELRVRARDGSIRVDFAVRPRTRGRWRAVIVHERRVEWRGS